MADLLRDVLSAVLDLLRRRSGAPPGRAGETVLHSNIDRSVEYRKEYYKYAIGIATALLAFTVSFPPQLSRAPEWSGLLFVGWGGLGVAIIAGVRVHMTWAKFFISYRDYDNRGERDQGEAVRDRLTVERHVLDWLQSAGLIVGVFCVVLFAAINVHNLAPKTGAEDPTAVANMVGTVTAPPAPPLARQAAAPPPARPPAARP